MNTAEQNTRRPEGAPSVVGGDANHLAEVLRKQAHHVAGKLPLLGAVGWLMMQQAATRHTLLSELEWRVMPPLVLEQAKVYLRDQSPVAYVSWAYLSEGAAQRYQSAPHHLGTGDWKSGEQIWIIDLMAPFGGASEVVRDLSESVFAGRTVHQLSLNAEGHVTAVTWPSSNPHPAT